MNESTLMNGRRSRAGIVLFVVLGSIFLLSILIMSYNHLVRGKFNESRELLKHLRAMKCAQSITRYIVGRMKSDLTDPGTDSSSSGQVLRAAFRENSASGIRDNILAKWFPQIGISDLRASLTANQSYEVSLNTNFEVSEVKALDDGKGQVLYLSFEKSGKLKVSVTVQVDNAVETWEEERPFRVVMPFPMPITKFNLYLRDAANGNDTRFNTVTIATPETGQPNANSPKPLIFINGASNTSNTPEDVWRNRGWIYLGGGPLLLNRSAGSSEYGQNFHSYFPSANKPVTLIFSFPPQPVGSTNVCFSVARWGFAETVYSGTHGSLWEKVLKRDFLKYPPGSAQSRWASSCLHLFGANKTDSGASMISHTRVIGDVKDRFIEICYLADASSKDPVGAMISMGSNEYRAATSQASNIAGMSTLFVENKLVHMPNGPSALGVQDLHELEPFFLSMPWLSTDGTLCYYTIMSKVDECSYSEIYDMIAQYTSTNQLIDIPPDDAAPKTTEMLFGDEIDGIDTRNIAIDKIAAGDDTTLGMARRVCYEVRPEQGKTLFQLLSENFCQDKNKRLHLGNSVLKVVTEQGAGMTLADGLGRYSGGNLIVDGPITVGTFEQANSAFDPPLMITAEKGAITLKNSSNGSNLFTAYFMALDKNLGEIKYDNPNAPINLVGGIAANSLDPANIAGGGVLTYNVSLDPTVDKFTEKYIGIVIGPAGGDI
ncbi:MAG: hypothetical protein CVV42_04495 [Candidatus Riflebacteria bacterium HGW-Riflebacteria-2]|nr:MAG: hypothetical protein CVV42_04495 [Candidatus Riflebacteria bacterium HGW-Riflebacteria-2]